MTLDRDERGRFVKGNNGGPGRPRNAEAYLEVTRSHVTLGDWAQIIDKAVDQAKRGNAEARKWLASYVIGMPVQRHELTGKDGEPIYMKWLDGPDDLPAATPSGTESGAG